MMRSLFVLLAALALPGALLTSAPAADHTPGGWGTVKGVVVWGGKELPKPPEFEMIKDHKDKEHCLSKGAIFGEEWVVNKDNKGVRWAFAWLAPESADGKEADTTRAMPVHPDLKAVKDKEVVMDQPCCKFEPHAVAVREGQVLVVKNSAGVVHNVNWQGGGVLNTSGNQLLPKEVGKVEIELKAATTPIIIACNIHPWMKSYVRVFKHPYYAVTDADGKFEIKNAPAGKYRLILWHEGQGWVNGGKHGQSVTIEPGKTADVGKVEAKPS